MQKKAVLLCKPLLLERLQTAAEDKKRPVLSRELASAMIARSFSVYQLAENSGVHAAAISRLLRGQRCGQVALKTMGKLAKALGVEVGIFLE